MVYLKIKLKFLCQEWLLYNMMHSAEKWKYWYKRCGHSILNRHLKFTFLLWQIHMNKAVTLTNTFYVIYMGLFTACIFMQYCRSINTLLLTLYYRVYILYIDIFKGSMITFNITR